MTRQSRTKLGVPALLAGLLLVAGWASAQDPLATDEPEIQVDADELSYDQVSNTVVAVGNVVVQRGGLQLEADEIRIARGTNEADARGEVVLSGPQGTYRADEIYINLDDETGFLRNASIDSDAPQFSISGSYVEKRSGQCYGIRDGSFTTCRCAEGPPSWRIDAEKLDVEVGGYGTLRGGTFRILDRPILYLPWAIIPILTERQTGLLGPRFAASDRRGFQILQPFFWAINKSHDLTVAVDVETSARVGLLGEHRYALSRNSSGRLAGTFFNESFRGNPDGLSLRSRIPENRWSTRFEHTQSNLLGGELYVDGFLVGDDGFLREINALATDYRRDVSLRTLQFTESTVGYWRAWERIAVRVEGEYYQDIDLTGLIAATPTPADVTSPTPQPTPITNEPRKESLTLQRAPAVDVQAQARVLGPVLGELTAGAVDYQRGASSDGLRFDIAPSLSVPLPLGRYAFGSAQAGMRETAYHLLQRQEERGDRLPRNTSRELFDVQAQAGTALARIYSSPLEGFDAFQHVVQPMVEYLYVPSVGQDDLPVFDSVDRIRKRNLVTYGVLTSLVGRMSSDRSSRSDTRELARLWMLQSVDLERDVPSLAENAVRDDPVTDLELGGRVHPGESLSLEFGSQVDVGAQDLSAAKVGFTIVDPRELYDEPAEMAMRSSAGITYRFLTGNELQEIDATIAMRLVKSLGLAFATRYDVVTNEFRDRYVGLKLLSQCNCWALEVGLTDRTNPQEIEASVRFSLVGFGSGSPLDLGGG